MNLKRKGIKALTGVNYLRIDKQGLHIEHAGENRVLDVGNIVICAGQVSNRTLADKLQSAGKSVHVIGGAHVAKELDAKFAIREGSELAATL